jgi:hypothetical protein
VKLPADNFCIWQRALPALLATPQIATTQSHVQIV